MLVQDAKFKRLTDHPMNQRMGQPVCRRLKRDSFLHQAKELIKQNTDLHNHTPKEIPICLSVPPWKSEALPNLNMEIPGIEDKRLQTPEERRGITDAFLNIHYPCDSWTSVYTWHRGKLQFEISNFAKKIAKFCHKNRKICHILPPKKLPNFAN